MQSGFWDGVLGSTALPWGTAGSPAVDQLAEQAARTGVRLAVGGETDTQLPLRPRMIRVVAS